MNEYIITSLIAAFTALVGWFISKLQTKRERKKSDLQLINDSVSGLVNSLQLLSDNNSLMVTKFLHEQEKVLNLCAEKEQLLRERSDLFFKIDNLEHKINILTAELSRAIGDKFFFHPDLK